VLLAESHLAVHTWPERSAVTLDVYVCNFSTDNSGRAKQVLEHLIDRFKPESKSLKTIQRGGDAAPDPGTGPLHSQERNEGSLLLEWLNEHSAYAYRSDRLVEATRSPWQAIEVHETPQWGRLFRLDGSSMTSERDEFHYHESLVHPAAITHPAPRSALVIGGGDGGAAEELLKHPSIERVLMAELDAEVIRVAREHLGEVHRGALEDPRLEIRIGEGWTTVEAIAQQGSEQFDLVLLDLTDPDTPAFRLYSKKFFALVRKVLAPGGALVLHVGSPIFKPERVQKLLGELAECYRIVRPMGVYVPLYGTYWGLAVASDQLDPCSLDPDEVARRLANRRIDSLQLYNEAIHNGLFALPNYYRRLLPGARND
jgi:spermidine synthase